ncbi:hypothetical protein DAI43_24965 [Achromobacter xylosoxidans]|uniref:DUF7673 family protein n=1 Tax=Achromobacter aegrifaciens TaxID=1287736 RepID=UPI000D40E87D|nr:ParB/RepB/Spo0J family partition protein [Achromobacter aegrifaciens]MDQ1758208.1 ParB/RepB/Spo0J family partition protein [Achromobacter aegrifaciens]PTN49214.1 hypothetical protein DAI43_24965 [Achromobacter xylosoxidans]
MNGPNDTQFGGGLDLAGLGDLASMLDGPQQIVGYQMYDIARIHPDPDNRRRAYNNGLSAESIGEMAATIRDRQSQGKRGVMLPISLRPHPSIIGDFMINHGHRRYLGSIEAGLSQIPGFEDPDFDDFDQMIENLQREGLSGREAADFIGGKLAEGMTQADIARKLGKSKAWVSMHVAMLDLPEPVAEAVANGQVTDVTLAKELVVAHRENPGAVEELLSSTVQKPTRASVKALRQTAEDKAKVTSSTKARDAKEHEPHAKGEISAQGSTQVASGENLGGSPSVDELPGHVREEFNRMRARCDQDERERSNPALKKAGMDALQRLIEIARRDTQQSKRVADFLLSWWNATSCGGFDLSDLWSVDAEIADDMVTVIGLIRRSRAYPDNFGTHVHDQFKALVALWRPQLLGD